MLSRPCAVSPRPQICIFSIKELTIMLHLFSRNKTAPGPVDSIIVGLGNPGRQYEGTRHNAGFFVLDTLAEQCGVKIDRIKFKGLTGDAMVGDKRVLLLKPSTYMNLSGESVRKPCSFISCLPKKSSLCTTIFPCLPANCASAGKEATADKMG